MSLFGTSSGFGTGGTGVFGSTTTDSHNPMKVNQQGTGEEPFDMAAMILLNVTSLSTYCLLPSGC